ncbi:MULTISPECIES: hypothetical protein [Streptomyces]|uniref:Integral membrane protein n=2 Tax=Streptomyces TaxID=1883 RepID=A0ABS9JPG2_9ACTN|nr:MULTISPECIES: hypothetical protein [Streptomyces]MCG0067450.1 hypothetical protein [Streptomyces tricolor]BCM72131.1 hypothetical protein EASAB2608_07465 [Streptomyces sp. EAS-AB2608]CUW26516.1 hypothetical protein TUE45_01228 [Streptomyces reticuli]
MSPRWGRAAGVAGVLAGIALGCWSALGPPQTWEGAARWPRHALALGSLGVIGLGARLVFPERDGGGAGKPAARNAAPADTEGTGT